MESNEDIANRLANEMAKIRDPDLRDRATLLLKEPSKKIFEWEYGAGEKFEGWLIADMGGRNVWAAYCEGGHGALGYPWGIVFKDSEYFGMDSGWYQSLHELFAEWFA